MPPSISGCSPYQKSVKSPLLSLRPSVQVFHLGTEGREVRKGNKRVGLCDRHPGRGATNGRGFMGLLDALP